ncbi:MAG: Phosphoglycerate mutase [Microgenomates group bacterium GW2011_GWC2_46_7]|nr:MAG: Phosphoglycerate mutase [Microgenomates group bacterium GW2011_GWC2_46_7]
MNWANDVGVLTDQGRQEANLVGKHLQEHHIDVVYVSDLHRTRETAQEIAQHVKAEQHLTSGIRERNLGIFGDLTLAEIKQKWPEKYAKFLDHSDIYWNGLAGESLHDVHVRFQAFLRSLQQKHADKNVLLVTHSGILYTVLRDIYHFFPQDSWMDVAHTSITILEKSDNTYILKSFNKI